MRERLRPRTAPRDSQAAPSVILRAGMPAW